jgi:hypothetical protein
MEFTAIKAAVHRQMTHMTETYPHLFKTDASKEDLWSTYLGSFRPEDNPIHRERTEHDCQCCKQFIRACGGMVAITEDNELVSIWDVDIGGGYQVVADAMSSLVKSKAIRNVFLHFEKNIGTDFNHEMRDEQNVNTWHHFHYQLPERFVNRDSGPTLSKSQSDYGVLERGIDEIRGAAVSSIIELIDAGSLYRGVEHKQALISFKALIDEAATIGELELFLWRKSAEIGTLSRFKNSVIGTLAADLSSGVELEDAVRMFESKVAPENYKRTKALVTPAMIARAKEKVVEKGLMRSIPRRHAVEDDITVNNVLYADRSFASGDGDIFDQLSEKAATQNIGGLKNAPEITCEYFLTEVMPKAEGIELLVENRLEHNMMSLIAPVNADCEPLFKWSNGFSWAYSGDVADSMKDRVKAAGGKVDGVLRFSLQWNDCGSNNIDFDAHCYEPTGQHIYYGDSRSCATTGALDVDIQNPGGKVAVENITWSDLRSMPDGEYVFKVKNYERRQSVAGFSAEIEFNGVTHSFSYDKTLAGNEYVPVAGVTKTSSEFTIKNSIPSTQQSRDVWGIKSQAYCKVSLIMNSPNHWDGEKTGNKHLFFILDGCNSGVEARGFYNEFLRDDLHENRKTFELLGSEMKAQKSSDQLSGLGFSSTQRNHVYCRVSGKSTRVFKINF